MLYEIINMSDPYTIEAHSLDVAFVACVFLGSGQYSFEPLQEGTREVPMFLFGGTREWCREYLKEEFESVVDRVTTDPAKMAELAVCFDSCLIGDKQDRETYRVGLELIDNPAKREKWRLKWRLKWHDDRRSSMNNIGARAYEMAAKLRKGITNPLVAAPRQVFAS